MSTRDFFNRDPLIVTVRQTIVLVVLPLAMSLPMVRRGWFGDWPGTWNWLSIIVIIAGFSVFIWCLGLKLVRARGGEGPTQGYLLVSGPFKFSRNPMFLSVLIVWLGWTFFYGSISVFLGLAAIWGYMVFVVAPSEERELEARFGEAYRSYKSKVPRWIGSGGS